MLCPTSCGRKGAGKRGPRVGHVTCHDPLTSITGAELKETGLFDKDPVWSDFTLVFFAVLGDYMPLAIEVNYTNLQELMETHKGWSHSHKTWATARSKKSYPEIGNVLQFAMLGPEMPCRRFTDLQSLNFLGRVISSVAMSWNCGLELKISNLPIIVSGEMRNFVNVDKGVHVHSGPINYFMMKDYWAQFCTHFLCRPHWEIYKAKTADDH